MHWVGGGTEEWSELVNHNIIYGCPKGEREEGREVLSSLLVEGGR